MDNYNKTGTATNKTILELYNMMKDGILVLQPSFQRKLVWNNKHKENFIQTILYGYPFPEIYWADGELDIENMSSKTLVVDGQQRLNTIYQYIIGDEDLVLKQVLPFKKLNKEAQKNFLDYTVVVRSLGRISEDIIKEIFNRINSVQYALNAMEINNALYEGEFITTAQEIVKSESLHNLNFMNDTEISRMKDLGFITLIMTTMEIGGYFTGNNEIENMIKRYDDEYPGKEKMYNDFIKVLDYINILELPRDSFWFRKSCMFTLITELLFIVYRDDLQLPDQHKCTEVLLSLERKITEAKDNNIPGFYNEFYNYIYQGTASKKGRNTRGEILAEELKKIM